ncbi:MAG: hypothetical protein ABSA16_18505 [Thermoguttaceae bacterium]|jgi:hypothetical protein
MWKSISPAWSAGPAGFFFAESGEHGLGVATRPFPGGMLRGEIPRAPFGLFGQFYGA